jgi:hypothetical protein
MISGIQFYENGVPNIMKNRGNYAIVKQVPLQPSPLWGKLLAKFIRREFSESKRIFNGGKGNFDTCIPV